MRALGPQASGVLERLKLTGDGPGVPDIAAIPPDPTWPDFPPMGYGPEQRDALELAALRAENADLRARVADLEHALRQADRSAAQAVRQAEQRFAETGGGRLPSIIHG